jgi:hypothetical protein
MIIKIVVYAVLAVAMLLIFTASAGADIIYGYITEPIYPWNHGIQSKYQTHDVFSKTTSLFVNLTWDEPSTKLVLTINRPDGSIFGVYYPAGGQGKYQTQIQVLIKDPNGIEKGTWGYYVSYEEGTANTTYTI